MPELLCQLTGQPIRNAITRDGFIYDRDAVQTAIARGELDVGLSIRDFLKEHFIQAIIDHMRINPRLSTEQLDELYRCPIDLTFPLESPVVCTVDGRTYSYPSLQLALEHSKPVPLSPMNRAEIGHQELVRSSVIEQLRLSFEREGDTVNLDRILADFRFPYPTSFQSLPKLPFALKKRLLFMSVLSVALEAASTVFYPYKFNLYSDDLTPTMIIHIAALKGYMLYQALEAMCTITKEKYLYLACNPLLLVSGCMHIRSGGYYSPVSHPSPLLLRILMSSPTTGFRQLTTMITGLSLIQREKIFYAEISAPLDDLGLSSLSKLLMKCLFWVMSIGLFLIDLAMLLHMTSYSDKNEVFGMIIPLVLSTFRILLHLGNAFNHYILPIHMLKMLRQSIAERQRPQPEFLLKVFLSVVITDFMLSSMQSSIVLNPESIHSAPVLMLYNLYQLYKPNAFRSIADHSLSNKPLRGLKYKDSARLSFWQQPEVRAGAGVDERVEAIRANR